MMQRCNTETCRKKTYSIMKCRCGHIYCGIHLGDHSCPHDYRSEHQESLNKQNPKVVASKVIHLEGEYNTPQ